MVKVRLRVVLVCSKGYSHNQEALTTVIGLKYQSGILLFSDTQESVPTNTGYSKSLFQGKLYPVGYNRCAIGCAGRSWH